MPPPELPIEVALPRYPAITWLARRGWAAVLVAAPLVALGGAGFAVVRASALWLIAGAAAAAALLFGGRLLVEIARLLADTLIPE